jgi:serine/threonine-protein kinase
MSRVFVVTEVALGRKVVLKVLPPELGAGFNLERFRREIQLAASLSHPHIVPLYSAGQVGDLPFYTMPLIEGESLRARIARDGELPIPDAVRLLHDIVDALACAHEHGVVHRDIKPDNVLISRNHAVVTDFGVAKALEVSGQASITTTGMALGTPAYMAPEQAAGDPHTDHRADLYAVGVLAYEMLTGRPPFTGPTAQSVLAAQVTQTPPPITASRANIPAALAAIIMRCLEKRPADRWQSAAELLKALEATTTPSGGLTPTTATAVGEGTLGATVALPSRMRPRVALVVSAGLLLVAALWGVLRLRGGPGTAGGARRVVVLPFENLGDTSRQYFANGVTEAITTQLTGLAGLSVIPRSTAFRYRGTQKTLSEIGHELGVSYVLEGTVQWEEARDGTRRVRVSPELIRIADTSSIWAHSYDAILASVFQVYSDVSTEVAKALAVALDDPERRALASRPTQNPESYDLYLRAVDYINRGISGENLHNASAMLERAVALDSNFALAWGRLSETLALAHWLYVDRTDETMARATRAAERAIAIAPELPEAHRALGNLYYRKRDYDKALAELSVVQRSQPNDIDLISAIGYVERRQGRWEESAAQFRKEIQLDPGAPRGYYDLGETLYIMRRYDEAAAILEKGIGTAPDEPDSYGVLLSLQLVRNGDLMAAQGVVRRELGKMGIVRLAGNFRPPAFVIAADPELRRTFLASTAQDFGSDSAAYYFFRGELRSLAGESGSAKALFDSARVVLESKLRQLPDDYGYHMRLGLAYARLGRYPEAVREGKKGVELLPPARDAYFGMNNVLDLARIYAAAGEPDSAAALLKQALAVPADISPALLRTSPDWDPIKSDPRFQQLLH